MRGIAVGIVMMMVWCVSVVADPDVRITVVERRPAVRQVPSPAVLFPAPVVVRSVPPPAAVGRPVVCIGFPWFYVWHSMFVRPVAVCRWR